MTELLEPNHASTSQAMTSWEVIDRLVSSELITFDEIGKLINSMHDQVSSINEFIEDILNVDDISIARKAMSLQILFHSYHHLFSWDKLIGLHALMLYYTKLNAWRLPTELTKVRVNTIIRNTQPLNVWENEVKISLFNIPFTMNGDEIDEVCKVIFPNR